MSFRPIFGIPRLSQDWDTEQEERETHWTSLFYDLMIVAALNAIAEPFEENENDEDEAAAFVLAPIRHLWFNAILQFLAVMGPWNCLNEYTSIVHDESFIGHIAFFLHCFGLAATTAGCVGELEDNYLVLAMGMILARCGMLLLYARPLACIPRARMYVWTRCGSFAVNILLMGYAVVCLRNPEEDFVTFRWLLVVSTLWDWASPVVMSMCLTREQRIPLHIQSYADRIKEVTMVIFGEAIFAIILQPHSGAKPETHFYLALGATLWLIYSMALQEFHILPSEDDHAMRRSVVFGFFWFYSQFFKQIFLLGASIGIKRAHLLMFRAPTEPMDRDTLQLIAWGLSMTMMSVVLIRSFSFGWGRHPSVDDPPPLYRLKSAWWLILASSCVLPQVLDDTIVAAHPQPLPVLVAYGSLMTFIILIETVISNKVGELIARSAKEEGGDHDGGGHQGEHAYLIRSSSSTRPSNYSSHSATEVQPLVHA